MYLHAYDNMYTQLVITINQLQNLVGRELKVTLHINSYYLFMHDQQTSLQACAPSVSYAVICTCLYMVPNHCTHS